MAFASGAAHRSHLWSAVLTVCHSTAEDCKALVAAWRVQWQPRQDCQHSLLPCRGTGSWCPSPLLEC